MSIVTEVKRRRLHKGSCTRTKIAIWSYFIIFAETDPPDVSSYLFTRAQSQALPFQAAETTHWQRWLAPELVLCRHEQQFDLFHPLLLLGVLLAIVSLRRAGVADLSSLSDLVLTFPLPCLLTLSVSDRPTHLYSSSSMLGNVEDVQMPGHGKWNLQRQSHTQLVRDGSPGATQSAICWLSARFRSKLTRCVSAM